MKKSTPVMGCFFVRFLLGIFFSLESSGFVTFLPNAKVAKTKAGTRIGYPLLKNAYRSTTAMGVVARKVDNIKLFPGMFQSK